MNTKMIQVGMNQTTTRRKRRRRRWTPMVVAIHLQRKMTLTSIGISIIQRSNLALAKESFNMQKSWQELQPKEKKRKQNLYK